MKLLTTELLTLLVLCHILDALPLSSSQASRHIKVTITTNITSHLLCNNQSVQLTCHADDVITHPSYQWTSSVDQLNRTSSDILVTASDHVVNYTCTVFSDDRKGGNSISMLSNGTVPYLYRENFNEEEIIMEEGSVNLTVVNNHSITSNWHRTHAPLPDDHVIKYYTIGATNYSSLTFSNASYSDDGGEYVFSGSNDCGDSDVSVNLNIKKRDVQCFPPGNAVPLVSKSVNKSIVEEEVVEFSCVFGGNYDPIDYTVIWSVTPHNGNATFIDDESDIADFEVTKPQQNCPHGNYSCCKFTTELKIHSNMSLNGAAVTCLVLVLEQPTSDTSYLTVYKRPTIMKGPDSRTLHKHDRVKFTCKFVASSLEHFTHAAWMRNDDPSNISTKAVFTNQTMPGNDTHFVYSLSISDVTESDEGIYSCYSYYNQTILRGMGIDHAIVSVNMSADLKVEGGLGTALTTALYAGAAVLVAALIILPTIIISFIYKKNTGPSYQRIKGEDDDDGERRPLTSPLQESDKSGSDTSHKPLKNVIKGVLTIEPDTFDGNTSQGSRTGTSCSCRTNGFEQLSVEEHNPLDTRPHMQALSDHVISQISEDKLQLLAYKLGLSQEVIDQLPVGKQGFEVMLKEWLKSGQRTWHDLVVALCHPQVDDQRHSDQVVRKLSDNVIQEELLQLKPMEFQLCQFVVDMVAPDWCAIAVGLEVEMRATNNESPVVELCRTVFQNYLKHCRHPTWKHILEVMESEAVGRKTCATFIKTILPEIVDFEPAHWDEVKQRKYPHLDMFVILTKLYIIPVRPIINGWVVDSYTLLEAVRRTVSVDKREINEIIDVEMSPNRRNKKVIQLLEKKMNASLCAMLAKRYRPGSLIPSGVGGAQHVSVDVHHTYGSTTVGGSSSAPTLGSVPLCDANWSRTLRENQFDLCCKLEPVISGIAIDLNEFIEREEHSKLTTTGYASDFQKVAIVITEVIKSNSEVVFNKFCESLCKHRHERLAQKLKFDSSI
ncbi:uncharacterized protein [Dysidea avara]|uniref:uncharacterized protein n=1 Tax=Dysidea avara TaxID=196820 RepID=UPI0033164EBA